METSNDVKLFALHLKECLFYHITHSDVCNINSEMEPGVVVLDEDGRPADRVESALRCLPRYDPAESWENSSSPFRYWKIRDYAHAYWSRKVTPSMVCSIQLIATSSTELSLF